MNRTNQIFLTLFLAPMICGSIAAMEVKESKKEKCAKDRIHKYLFEKQKHKSDHDRMVKFIDRFFNKKIIYENLENTENVEFYWNPDNRIDLNTINQNKLKNHFQMRKYEGLYELNYSKDTGRKHHSAIKEKVKDYNSDKVVLKVFKDARKTQCMLQIAPIGHNLANINPFDEEE